MTDLNLAPGLRVGYVLKRFPRLSETFILNELLELRRQGVQVEVFSLLRPPEEPRHALLAELDAPVTWLPGSSALGAWTVSEGLDEPHRRDLLDALAGGSGHFGDLFSGKDDAAVAKLHVKATTVALLARARGIHHLHAHFGSDAATVALLAGRLAALPFSFTAHARDIYHVYVDRKSDDRMRAAKMREAAFVATVSEYNRSHLSGLVDTATASRIHRLYNGIDLARFAPAPGPRPPVILSVGRLIEKKGFTDLVAACELLAQRGVDFRCLVVGEGPDRDALQAQVETAGLGGRVELLGALPQERIRELLGEVRLMALPCVVSGSGDRDGLPTVLLEALAAGLPAVTTTVSGGPEIVEDGVNGLLVPQREPALLAGALTRLLADPALAERMGRAGRERAEERFDLARNVATLRDHFARAAGRPAPAEQPRREVA